MTWILLWSHHGSYIRSTVLNSQVAQFTQGKNVYQAKGSDKSCLTAKNK